MIYIIVVVFVIYLSIVNAVQAFKCPDLTNTELFLLLDESFWMDWTECKNN